MNTQDFDTLLKRRIDKIETVLRMKAREYSNDEDRLYNFRRAAEVIRKTPETALWGFLMKHIVSVMDMIEDLERCQLVGQARIDEKIGDCINYFILLEALMYERTVYHPKPESPYKGMELSRMNEIARSLNQSLDKSKGEPVIEKAKTKSKRQKKSR